MLGTISLIEKGMWVTTGIFAVAAVLLICTTVRLSIFARRREVEIMHLVGATNWFIRWPFVLEGFFTGLSASLLAAAFVWVAQLGPRQLDQGLQISTSSSRRVYGVWWQERHLAARPAAHAGDPRRRARRRGQPSRCAATCKI